MTSALNAFQLGLFPVLMTTLSIGPQNTFVLRHGLANDRLPLVVGVCLGSDIGLIAAATLGFGEVIAANLLATRLLTCAGAGYLLIAAIRMLRSARGGERLKANRGILLGLLKISTEHHYARFSRNFRISAHSCEPCPYEDRGPNFAPPPQSPATTPTRRSVHFVSPKSPK